MADRFTNPEGAEEATLAAAARSELDAEIDAEYDEKVRQADAAAAENTAEDAGTGETE